jgi:protein involved in polysaccharide export with SLBB domain
MDELWTAILKRAEAKCPLITGCAAGIRRLWGMRLRTACCAVLLVGFLSSCAADKRITVAEMQSIEESARDVTPVPVEPSTLALAELRPYTVGSGDVLAIRMYGLTEERYTPTTLELRVQDDGHILMPVVGPVRLAGLNLKQVEQAVIAAHTPAVVKDMSVYVQLVEPESTTVLVLGTVAMPGLVKLKHNERNVVYALAAAGGFGSTATAGGFSSANSGRVHVRPIRPEREPIVYNLNDVNDMRLALLAAPLESGDMVIVEPAESNAIYVTGLVNAPGPVPVPANGSLSLVRTVAAAGGVRDFLDPPEATLWRRLPDGQQLRVKVDLAEVLAGNSADFALRAGDVLDVPHTPETRFREWVAANIRIGPFGVTAVYDPVADYRARVLRGDQYNTSGTLRRSLMYNLGTGFSELIIPPVPEPLP